RFGQVGARIEPIPAGAAIRAIGRVNILKVLSLVLKHTCVLETGTIFESSNIAGEHAGSAALKTADKYVLVVSFIVDLHNCILSLFRFSDSLHGRIATGRLRIKPHTKVAVELAEQDQHHSDLQS